MAMGDDALSNPITMGGDALGNPLTMGSDTLGNPAAAEGGNAVTFCQQRQLSLTDAKSAMEHMTGSSPGGAGWEAALEEPDPYAKPAYSADQLRSFKEQENTAQLLFVAQVYVGRTLTASDMKTILYLSDVLRFSDDLIDYLIQYCVDRGKKDFRYMEKVAVSWAQQGITTPKQAQKAALKYDKSVYAIMNELGKSSAPTNKELEYINRWTREYGFTPDIIFEACERTVMAVDKHRFEYAEGILSSWRKENVRHKADIKRVDEQHQKQKSAAANTAPRNSAAVSNKFNQFKQNTYNFEELEKELLSN
ncbi:MAG: DnaD domain protein [Lachnospiraceae bacterium]|nr:DnaD domain protein [Lachnospiraceae bacterium]